MDPASLAILSVATTAVSTGVGVMGAMQEGKAAKQAAEYNAKVSRQNAEIARQNADWVGSEGEQRAATSELRNRQRAASIKTNQAAAGIDIGGGSAKDVQESQAITGRLDTDTIRSNAARQAYGYQTDAVSQGAKADLETVRGKNAKKAAYLNAGTTFLGGVGSAGSSYSEYLNKNSLSNDDTWRNPDLME